MSIIKRNEDRRYFPGESRSYINQTEHGMHIDPGLIPYADFFEMVLRAVAQTDIDQDEFDRLVEEVIDYYEQEYQHLDLQTN